jgi:antitoxin YefM
VGIFGDFLYYSGSIIETITYTEARDRFADILNRVEATRDVILITRRGHANVALIAEEELSSVRETAHLIRSSANARRLLESLARSMEKHDSLSEKLAKLPARSSQ